jgi:GNAT superfamily N-acetyltransferase
MADAASRYLTPAVLDASHDISVFDSGEPTLDSWLRERAMDNIALGASRTYVTCLEGHRRVAGYYALSMGHIQASGVPGGMRRNMPRDIPSVILGRLAIDRRHQGLGLGAKLLRHAVMKSALAAAEVSARLVLVHAISDAAESFYLRHGFVKLPGESVLPTLALDLVKFAKVQLG